jgi:hypothetical protein
MVYFVLVELLIEREGWSVSEVTRLYRPYMSNDDSFRKISAALFKRELKPAI